MSQNAPVTREDFEELRRAIFERIQEMETRLLRSQEISRLFDEDNEIGARNNHMGYTEDDVEGFVDEVRADHAALRLG